ncbi:MAG: MoaA/NirJ family Fe-S oxidoreductase [Candidatus Moranbacteria bacterium GW2011_GWC2_37_73]|nr:MAG: radical SAM domain protein [Parcubacteria group bacterium GW2011_GWC1_36_108]KKQ00142.1 MAG: MoaA/NirJ family Fe-S oxidoreductase [Candidatus Moranbacteria bacterium GW2011_GWD1_36_198]KKQ00212.1 MAG: MoaA/NirJ family Fe-S oxidoreductase [Candidatus Moranbacteria bacterium GW2011_GWD2_36_198]KKQ39555.1 MAG: MoaA/NirJ family Fe-S oxidoreductase [Candidatus Moranbacteria bacterium GW2011_GWC2_37_73]
MIYRTLSAPLSVQIEITDNCNQVCTHCYRACQHIKKAVSKHLLPSQAEKLVEELARWKVMSVCFTGGEPLMFKETLKAGIRKAKELGLVVYCNTNLQLLTREMSDFFYQNSVGILTSLLSHQPEIHDVIIQREGFHKRLLSNVLMLTETGVLTSANMVVRKENAHQVYETGKLAHSLGILRFSATKVAPSPDTEYRNYRATPQQIKESMDALLHLQSDLGLWVEILETYPLCFIGDMKKYQQFLRRNCTAGVFNCSISPDGSIRPCAHADMTYGNLFEKSLQECWFAMQEWRDGTFLYEKCRICPHLLRCSGGCRMDAKIFYNDIHGKDPLMTGPEKVNFAENTSQLDFQLPNNLKFVKGVQIRAEEFGGVVKYNDELVFLNKAGYNTVLNLLSGNKYFSWKEVDVEGVSVKDRELFFKVLFDKKMFLVS